MNCLNMIQRRFPLLLSPEFKSPSDTIDLELRQRSFGGRAGVSWPVAPVVDATVIGLETVLDAPEHGLCVPGNDSMSVAATIVLGIIGSFIGAMLKLHISRTWEISL